MSLNSKLASLVQAIGADIKALVTGKVSVVSGKGLSTNDYTTTEQTKLAAVKLPGYETQVTTATAAGAVPLNLSLGTVFELTLTGATTISLSNSPSTASGQSFTFVVRLIQNATTKHAVTWPSGITWLNTGGVVGDSPALGKIIEYVFSLTAGSTLVRKGASN